MHGKKGRQAILKAVLLADAVWSQTKGFGSTKYRANQH
jgi:hypothetical protein